MFYTLNTKWTNCQAMSSWNEVTFWPDVLYQVILLDFCSSGTSNMDTKSCSGILCLPSNCCLRENIVLSGTSIRYDVDKVWKTIGYFIVSPIFYTSRQNSVWTMHGRVNRPAQTWPWKFPLQTNIVRHDENTNFAFTWMLTS